jgi:hypothetical protein
VPIPAPVNLGFLLVEQHTGNIAFDEFYPIGFQCAFQRRQAGREGTRDSFSGFNPLNRGERHNRLPCQVAPVSKGNRALIGFADL